MLLSSPQALLAGLLPRQRWHFVSFSGELLSFPVIWPHPKCGEGGVTKHEREGTQEKICHSTPHTVILSLRSDPDRPTSTTEYTHSHAKTQ